MFTLFKVTTITLWVVGMVIGFTDYKEFQALAWAWPAGVGAGFCIGLMRN